MKLFVIRYKFGEKGCPEFVAGELSPFPKWKPFFSGAFRSVEDLGFTFKAKHKNLECAYFTYGVFYVVSNEFKSICDELNVRGAFAPVKLELSGGNIIESRFFLYWPGDHRSVLDVEKSVFTVDISGDTGFPMTHEPDFPNIPNASRIDRFVVDVTASTDAKLFYCVDIGELVCSEDFANRIGARNLKGIATDPIDDSFRFRKYEIFDD